MRISDWSSDVCSSDLPDRRAHRRAETDRALLGTGCEMPRVREQLTADAPIVVIERRMRDRAPRPFIGIGLHLQRAGIGIKADQIAARSEERSVGKEWVSQCRFRWSTDP